MSIMWPGRGGPACDYISDPPAKRFCEKFSRRLALLGSTGSIGRNALEIIAQNPERLQVFALAAGRNVELLARQARQFRPEFLAVQDGEAREALLALLPDFDSDKILAGDEGYAAIASLENVDLALAAQAGAAGLAGTLSALLAGKVLALANKESLVLAGRLCRMICRGTGASILPVDSEHYALFQCLCGRGQTASKLILTASGGPFRSCSVKELEKASLQEAMRHPSWNMGAKITIDSSTLMNKGLEIIEAMHLFGVPAEAIQVLVHPQSIIHSLVLFQDNGLLAQMALPDMKLPIADCLLWPDVPPAPIPAPDLAAIGKLEFFEPDQVRFRCLALAREIANAEGQLDGPGICPGNVMLNAANEAAVKLFRQGKIGFMDISRLVEKALRHFCPNPCLEELQISTRANPAQEALRLWRLIRKHDERARDFVNSF